MASQDEAARAASAGADLDRPLQGEDPASASLVEARHWASVYRSLVALEEQLLDLFASHIPSMPREAQIEAEETNLPVLLAQVERFRHRLQFWVTRERELELGMKAS
jgi:hypothetical protein